MTATAHEAPTVYASYSSLVSHRTCPQAWAYRNLDRLQQASDEPTVARDLGTWWHALRAVEAIRRGREHRTLQHAPDIISTTEDGPTFAPMTEPKDVIKAARAWWRTKSSEYHEAAEGALGEPLPARLLHLYLAWRERWAEEIQRERPLGVEMWWTRTLPSSPEDPEGVPLSLGGVVDEVYYDTRRSMVVVRDHKSHAALDAPGTGSLAEMQDSQLHLYAWGIAPVVESWGKGPIRAVAYDRARAVAPKTPKLTISGTLSKSVTDYDLATYLAWVGDGIEWGEQGETFKTGPRKGQPKFGAYTTEEKVIERLSSETERARWFQRSLTPLNRNLQALHEQAASDSAADIARTKARHARTGQAQRNFTRMCSWCDFAALCRAQMVGGPDGAYPPQDYGLERRPGRS